MSAAPQNQGAVLGGGDIEMTISVPRGSHYCLIPDHIFAHSVHMLPRITAVLVAREVWMFALSFKPPSQ
jgi:hypothetical protein